MSTSDDAQAATEPSPRAIDPIDKLEQDLGWHFCDRRLLVEALTHRSFVNECSDPDVRDNERFEFLGDAVIDLVISTLLMERHGEAREGALSKMRATLVSEEGLARVADSLGLGNALRLGRGEELSGGREKPSILADAFEALMAAVYLDAGLDTVRRLLEPRFDLPESHVSQQNDPKTELQQRLQAARRAIPTYRLVEQIGPDHSRIFVIEISVGDEILGRGEGRSKKEAEQRAAASVLGTIEPKAG